VGKPGRQALRLWLDEIVSGYGIDLTIANGENAAGGIGLTREVAEEIYSYGIDVVTMGNHVWDKKEIMDIIDEEERLLRPLNYPAPAGFSFPNTWIVPSARLMPN